jgi:transcriptional regulator with XRE-family HTH domain
MTVMTSFGPNLARARGTAGLSQAEVASAAHTSQGAIARLELGVGNPTLETLCRVAAATGYAVVIDLQPLAPADPVVEVYKRDVDRTLLRENLRRTVDERIRSLGDWQESLRMLEISRATLRRPQ